MQHTCYEMLEAHADVGYELCSSPRAVGSQQVLAYQLSYHMEAKCGSTPPEGCVTTACPPQSAPPTRGIGPVFQLLPLHSLLLLLLLPMRLCWVLMRQVHNTPQQTRPR